MAVPARATVRRDPNIRETSSWLNRSLVTTGLVGGAGALYFIAVGMVEKFQALNVLTNVLALGRTLLIITFLVVGYVAARRLERQGHEAAGLRLSGGVVAGAVAGAVAAVVLLFVDLIGVEHVRRMFQAFTPTLVNNVLSFGQSVMIGVLALLVGGAALGLGGAGLQIFPPRLRRATTIGLLTALIVSLAHTFIIAVFRNLESNFGIDIPLTWLFTGTGLAYSGLVLMFAAGFAFSWWRTRPEAAPETRRPEELTGERTLLDLVRGRPLRILGWLAVAALLILMPFIVGQFLSQVINTVGIYVLLGLGLNIVVGFAGLLDLGYVAFFAVGAYATAILTSTASFLEGPFNFWVALPLVLLIAVFSGILIGAPVLRLRGDYLAIVTLGFGEIARVFIASIWLQDFLGGAQGILRIPGPPFFGVNLRDPLNLYYIILAFCIIAAFVAWRLKESRVGRAWAAMREDETVAEAMGISVINYKLLAFAIGAGVGCLGGAFFAIQVGSVFPNSMDLLVSINALSVIVLGGMGSIPGVVLGAFGLVGLPELLREFEEFRLLIYGAVLVALMILKPEGLLPEVRRRQELHERELEEEQYEDRVGEGAEPVLRAEASDDEETT
ncbi:MAG TPA: branched-chain amino acid ABC transporter permease [Actinomycetota bacterium]